MFTLKPAVGENFIDREEVVQEIVSTLLDKNLEFGFALYGNRKLGKTSILREVERRLKSKKEVVVIYLSVWDLRSDTLDEFVRELSLTLLEAYRPHLGIQHKFSELILSPISIVKGFLKEMKLSVKLKEEIELILSWEQTKKESNLDELFTLAEELARETKTRCLFFIDEFPSLADLKNAEGMQIFKKLRSIYEKTENVILCVSGSIKKTMEVAVLSDAAPFYRQFIAKKIAPLSEKDAKHLILKNFEEKVNGEVLEKIWQFTHGIPFYLQFIGKKMYKKKEIGIVDIEKIIQDFLEEEGDLLFKEEFRRLSPKEKIIAIVMAKNNFSKASEIAKSLYESDSKIYNFLSYLEEKGILVKEEDEFIFQDPIFKEWLVKRFSNV